MSIELSASGLPIRMDETTHRLSFHEGLTCEGGGTRKVGEMKPLLYRPDGLAEDETAYSFYRDIAYPRDRELLRKYDFRYDITVVEPGEINGERKKTSGHYHGLIGDSALPYPEIYEVVYGRALYILQKVEPLELEAEPVIRDLKAVFVKAGQAIVIPPFYGHCSINAGSGPLVFSNIAVVSCPLFYKPISRRHGLALYALDRDGEVELVPNPRYTRSRRADVIFPREDPAMGITFGHPVYRELMDSPETFSYLLEPADALHRMDAMLAPDNAERNENK